MIVFEIKDGRLPEHFLTDATPSQKFRAQAMWARYALAQDCASACQSYSSPVAERIVARALGDIIALRVAAELLPMLRTLRTIEILISRIETIAKGIDYAGGKSRVDIITHNQRG